MFVNFSYFCQLLSSYKTRFGKTPNTQAHEARPDTLIGRFLGAIRALWSAWQPLKVLFSVRVDKATSLVFSSHQVHNRQSQISSFQCCRPLAVRVRHAHMRNTAVARCVCRSLPYVFHHICRFKYHILFHTSYLVLFFVQTQAGVAGNLYHHHHLSPCSFFCPCELLCVI